MGRTAAATKPAATPRKKVTEASDKPRESYRDTVEAIVVALILALVVRGFEAQAFVIPTGSMAPTLMGRHKELTCPQCGFVYTVNASHEVEGGNPSPVYSGVCSNCRFQARELTEDPSFKGDRILVMMFPYDLPFLPGAGAPARWDVVVFRYPEEPEVSYIKRLIGLPGETVRIKHGDIYIKRPGSEGFRLERKPLEHQTAMQMNVYDDRFRPKALADLDQWRRWRSETPGGWKSAGRDQGRYQAESQAKGEWVELKYRHLVPDPEQWEAILTGSSLPREPRPSLITDFYSYNTNLNKDGSNLINRPWEARYAWMQPHWVGDLTLSANLEVASPAGELRLELVKGGVSHYCTIDLATGMARFARDSTTIREFNARLKGPGRYQIEFANVDDRMTLLVDGRQVDGPGVEYERGDSVPVPTVSDLAPAGIAVRDASVTVSDLVLKRDIYYTQTPGDIDYGTVFGRQTPRNPIQLLDFLADPSHFASFSEVDSREFNLGEDRFLMLGDNSPQSKDSRGWDSSDLAWDSSGRQAWEVPRNLLTGKAFYIYWPHGVPLWPHYKLIGDIRVPFRPYVERMRWIR
jgi:signal peptidase I